MSFRTFPDGDLGTCVMPRCVADVEVAVVFRSDVRAATVFKSLCNCVGVGDAVDKTTGNRKRGYKVKLCSFEKKKKKKKLAIIKDPHSDVKLSRYSCVAQTPILSHAHVTALYKFNLNASLKSLVKKKVVNAMLHTGFTPLTPALYRYHT